jgi:hypothetical protein
VNTEMNTRGLHRIMGNFLVTELLAVSQGRLISMELVTRSWLGCDLAGTRISAGSKSTEYFQQWNPRNLLKTDRTHVYVQ